MADPKALLENFAHGSFAKVIEKNNRLFLIETKTVKVKNKVLREFVEQAKQDGHTDETLIKILLEMDEAVENNNVKKKLNDYLT